MPFKKLTLNPYPPRHWSLFGDPGSGKSTFTTQLRGPILVVDADHRYQEVARLISGDVFTLDSEGNDPEAIVKELRAGIAGSGIKTIVVDSLTAIISPLISQAILDNDSGRNKNKVASFKPKALAMRLLQDTLSAWGTDVIWIYHTRSGMDAQARESVSTSISLVELARLRRSLNMTLRVVENSDGVRGIKVEWARRGRSGMILWDDSTTWQGMPQKIEAAVYDGLSREDQDQIEHGRPTSFSGPDAAIAWGFEQGCFNDALHAKNAYDEIKRTCAPKNAAAMWQLWVADVEQRMVQDLAAYAPPDSATPTSGGPGGTPTLRVPESGGKDDPELWEPERSQETAGTPEGTPLGSPLLPKQPGLLSQAQLTRILILVSDVYGAAYRSQEGTLCQQVSNGVVNRFKNLDPQEAEVLIADLEAQKQRIPQKAAVRS